MVDMDINEPPFRHMMKCFCCHCPVPPFDADYGPICGPAEDHPACTEVVWHRFCRLMWLAALEMWGDVSEPVQTGTLSDGVDTKEVPMGTIRAPFSERQVAELNRYQVADIMHPFTCPHDRHDEVVLLATTEGWHCPVRDCGYRQDWAHAFMADS